MDFFDFIKNNKFIILIVSIIFNMVLLVSTSVLLYQNLSEESELENEEILEPTSLSINNEENFFVEIKGAVKNPGVYKVSSNNIINDVVLMAGGFNSNAYTNNINLSRKVSSEMVIYVYTKTEFKSSTKTSQTTKTVVVQEKCECPTYDITSCTDNKQSEIVINYNKSPDSNSLESSVVTETTDSKVVEDNNSQNEINNQDNTSTIVNINTASKEELMTLNGIGESKAAKIIEYRNANGKFKNIDEIKNVSGIGDAMFAKIKNNITV